MRILLLLVALLPISSMAQGFGPLRWDYVTANLMIPELNDLGLELEGSTAVTKDLVVFGTYMNFDPRHRRERSALAIGVGHRWNIRPSIDVLVSASYGTNEFKRPGRNDHEDGLILGFKVRGWATAKLELNGGLDVDNSIGSNTDTVLSAGLQYFRERNISFGGRIRADEDDTTFIAGARFYFGASSR